ncbi:MAG: sigma-70 family RNA polymerase sigma factor [Planctomycetota bacterium]|jgi:RNA polymerase sigma-70 factor (ECF subfamily)
MDTQKLAGLPDHEIMALLRGVPHEELVRGFEVLVKRHKNAVVSFLYRYVGNYRTAEDLAQETFLRIFRKVDAYDNRAKFTTWMYTIASNLAKDEFKYRRRHPAAGSRRTSGAGSCRRR